MFHIHKREERPEIKETGRRSFFHKLVLSCFGLSVLTTEGLGAPELQKNKKSESGQETRLPEETLREMRVLTRSRFAALLNDNFATTYGAGDTYILQLVEVADLPMPAPARQTKKPRVFNAETERENSFVLRFRGAFETPLPQKTFTLRHPTLGEHEIFLVPAGMAKKETGARIYEAVFNRHIE